ncbi:hypothetical protein M0802_014720, partial [Mischocyttarus mexicanus]
LGILLVVRLALLHGALPKFSPQDNPAAFHPFFHVRKNVTSIKQTVVILFSTIPRVQRFCNII